MKIKIRYDNQFQALELNQKETEQLCVSLSLDPSTADEKAIQEAFDVQYNRPEYNNWQKYNRHQEYSPRLKNLNGQAGYYAGGNGEECSQFSLDMLADTKFKLTDFEYEDLCRFIRKILNPYCADMFIAICLDGMPMTEFGKKVGSSKQLIYKQLNSSKEKLKKFFLENGLL